MTKKIHLIFKTHLDVGFTNYASVVVNNYFTKYIPASLRVARQLRESGNPERFIWTTGSWLIYEYLEQALPAARAEMERAIALGDITWHALPFTTHTELMDVELFRFGLTLSQTLDRRFGKTTIAAKMTDVPGHTRGIVPLLAEAGVKFLHIGVNQGSTVPKVPPLFRWQDETGAELVVMYESGYGNAFSIPGLDDSLAFGHTMDNLGPQSEEQILQVYRDKQAVFPGAKVFASTLDRFAEKLEKVRESLPILDAEIGDSWIHGVGSDPIKVSRFRELLRLRLEWLSRKKVDYQDSQFRNFNRKLLLVPEHTWGMDEKTFLGDHENYDAKSFKNSRGKANFKKFESSWVEKRAYIQNAVNAFEESPLGVEARQRLEEIRPRVPVMTGWKKLDQTEIQVVNQHFRVKFSRERGTILSLIDLSSQLAWADARNPLISFSYQTFSVDNYERFFRQYILPAEQGNGWSREDFTKPGLEQANPISKKWLPNTLNWYSRESDQSSEVLFHLTFENKACQEYGAPQDIFLRYQVNADAPSIFVDLQWFKKSACRLPEAFWFSFVPSTFPDGDWTIEKLGKMISPLKVVENGNRHLHAVGRSVLYQNKLNSIRISPLDSTLVAPGEPSLLDFNNHLPDLAKGMHFCLHNNLWGTNFPMWFEEDCRFRFLIETV
jgi:hypothetical protein